MAKLRANRTEKWTSKLNRPTLHDAKSEAKSFTISWSTRMALVITALASFCLQTQASEQPTPPPPAESSSSPDIQQMIKQSDQGADAKPAPAASDDTDPETSRKLQLLEAHFFGHLYVNDPAAKRVSRLEQFVFGVESGGPFITRLNKVEETLHLKDPDGTKRDVPLVRPEPKTVQQPQQPVQPAAKGPDEQPTVAAAENNGLGVPDIVNQKPNVGTGAATASAVEIEKAALAAGKAADPQTPSPIALRVTKENFTPQGKPTEIVHELDMALRVHPTDAELYYERAKAMIQMDRLGNAISDLDDAIRNQPNRYEYYLARAWCHKKQGNSFLADDDIKQARFVNPTLPKDIDLSSGVEPKHDSTQK